MKTLLTLIFSTIIFTLSFGQLEWAGNHEFSEGASQLFQKSNGEIVLVHGLFTPVGNGITVFDSSGAIVFSQLLNGVETTVSDFVELPDSSLMFFSNWGECDIIVSAISRWDKNWEEVWTQYMQSPTGPATLLSDNSFVMGWNGSNVLEAWSQNGEFLWGNHLMNFNIKDIVVTPNDTLFVVCEEGLIKVSHEGILLNINTDLIIDRLEIKANGEYLAVKGNQLLLLSPSFATLATAVLAGDIVQDFIFNDHEIVALAADHVYRFDHALQPLGGFDLVGENQTFGQLSFFQNGLLVAGSERYGSSTNSNSSAFVKSYTFDGQSIPSVKDVGVESVQLTGLPILTLPNNHHKVRFENIKITVRNDGTATVNQLNLNIKFPFFYIPFWCIDYQESTKAYQNLALQPGQSVELTWDVLEVRSHTPFSIPLPMCFWTSLPDHKLDANAANDVACIDLILDEKEVPPYAAAFVFPNPSAADFSLQYDLFSNTAAKAQVYDALGRRVQTLDVLPGNGKVLIEGLTKGLYLVVMEVEGAVVFREKVVRL